MADPSNIRNTFLYNPKVNNLKILFGFSFNIKKTDYNLFNKYIIYKVN